MKKFKIGDLIVYDDNKKPHLLTGIISETEYGVFYNFQCALPKGGGEALFLNMRSPKLVKRATSIERRKIKEWAKHHNSNTEPHRYDKFVSTYFNNEPIWDEKYWRD